MARVTALGVGILRFRASRGKTVYLHAGMPRTATTALQTLLAANPSVLRDAGFVYPDRWRDSEALAHHALVRDVLSGRQRRFLEAEFLRFLETERAEVIVSSEAAIYGFGVQRRTLLKFLGEMKRRRRTRFVFALRRVDEYCESVYCQEIRSTDLTLTPTEYVRYTTERVPEWFETLQLVQDTLGPESVHLVKFERAQHFFEAMLDALGLTAGRYAGPRVPPVVNETFSLKGQVALVHHRRLSQELGFDVRRYHLWAAVQGRHLRFAEDRERYPVISHELATRAHQTALEVAGHLGFRPYLDFFASELPEPRGEPVSLEFGVLTEDDKAAIRSTLCELVRINGLDNDPRYHD